MQMFLQMLLVCFSDLELPFFLRPFLFTIVDHGFGPSFVL